MWKSAPTSSGRPATATARCRTDPVPVLLTKCLTVTETHSWEPYELLVRQRAQFQNFKGGKHDADLPKSP